jgi:hypothetical protein
MASSMASLPTSSPMETMSKRNGILVIEFIDFILIYKIFQSVNDFIESGFIEFGFRITLKQYFPYILNFNFSQ